MLPQILVAFKWMEYVTSVQKVQLQDRDTYWWLKQRKALHDELDKSSDMSSSTSSIFPVPFVDGCFVYFLISVNEFERPSLFRKSSMPMTFHLKFAIILLWRDFWVGLLGPHAWTLNGPYTFGIVWVMYAMGRRDYGLLGVWVRRDSTVYWL